MSRRASRGGEGEAPGETGNDAAQPQVPPRETRPPSGRGFPESGDPTRLLPTTPTLVAAPPALRDVPNIPDVVIEAELGRGGMGVVYKGRQVYVDRAVAVKLLRPDGSAAGEQLALRFRREATILAQLQHPHIVACHSAGTLPDGACWLVMEYIAGPDLRRHLATGGPLTERDALRVARDIADALASAHARGIIHRDVKPENVLLEPLAAEGAVFPWRAKLVDLGLARPAQAVGDAALTQQGMLVGTPATMAPEQFAGEDVDFRADIYGLGCVLYAALTGRPAFAGATLPELVAQKVSGVTPDPLRARAGLSRGTVALVAWMLAAKREDRPRSYAELIARIDTLLAPSRRPAWPVLAAAAAALMLVAGGIALPLLARSPRPAPAPVPTVVPAPVVAPAPVAPAAVAPVPAPAAIAPETEAPLGLPRPLLGREFTTALADWRADPGWGLAEDGEGLIGFAAERPAVLARPLDGRRWRLTLELRPGRADQREFTEAGVRIAGDAAVAVVELKHLGIDTYLADGFRKLPAPPWPVVLEARDGQLVGTVADLPLAAQALPAGGLRLELMVSGGALAVSPPYLAGPAR